MKRVLAALFTLSSLMIHAHEELGYSINIDLDAVKDDQLNISVHPPASSDDFIEYHMAKVVPGTYDESNFGSFVNRLKAYDTNGTELTVERLDTNRWKIQNGGKLKKINYWVHDTFDRFGDYGDEIEDFIFEPNGTNFDKYRNAFLINTFGVVGYVNGMKDKPYQLRIKHSPKVYGASALDRTTVSDTVDIFMAEDFSFLADGPIMYTVPDTVTREIANAKVMVSS
ncbi:MAG: peptidase M61, partial [Cyclobacteriaceae bacterium]